MQMPPLPAPHWWLFVIAFGLVWGSFLNVVIHRLPAGRSLIRPASHCPACWHAIPWYENLPVVSWLALGGRCRECARPISVRYPIVELGTAALVLLVAWFHSNSLPELLAWSFFVCVLWALAWIDLEHYILPNALTYALVPVGVALSFFLGGRPPLLLAVDVLAGPLVLLAFREGYYRLRGVEGLGLGDVKLMAGVGAFLGWRGVLGGLCLGSIAGSIAGIGLMLAGSGSMQSRLPFGPFLVFGALAWMVLRFVGLADRILPPLAFG